MKKIILFASLLISTLGINAQESNLSLSAALPVGDAGDITTFGLNLDINSLWKVSEQFDLGIATGYHYYFGDDIETTLGSVEIDDYGFLPLAVAGRINAGENISFGADVGYAIGINPNGNDGGFYYAPKIQFGMIVLAYKSISLDSDSFDAFTLGLNFSF